MAGPSTSVAKGSSFRISVASRRFLGRRCPPPARISSSVSWYRSLSRDGPGIDNLGHSGDGRRRGHAERQVRVHAHVGGAVLDAEPVLREAKHAGTVVHAVGHVSRGPGHGAAFEAADPGNQAVVGIDRGAGDGGERTAVAQQSADRVVRRGAPTAARVLEQVHAGSIDPLHRVVDVRARPPIADSGLGHEGDEHAMLLGHLLQQDAQQHQAVGHPQDVRVAEVELELRVGAFRDHVLQPPAELLQDVDERAEEPHGVDGVLGVVAERLPPGPHAFSGRRIVVEGLDRLALAPAHGDELRLDTRESGKSLRGGVAHDALERLART